MAVATIVRKFDFLLIGAQKAGTSWLWDKLNQHPGTDLPAEKEIHFFGGVELYRRGPAWYYSHFEGIRPELLTGEASTSYLYDRIPYWHNDTTDIEYATDLNTIPELVAAENPDVKIVVVLRDPVQRAISAYRHWMKKSMLSPLLGLRQTSIRFPKLRILEYGYYARYLQAWRNVFSDGQIQVLFFEEDIRGDPEAGVRKTYEFLGLDTDFRPDERESMVHKSWSWTRSAVGFYAGPFRRYVNHGPVGEFLDRNDFLNRFSIRSPDIEFLRKCYLPEKTPLEQIVGRKLDIWDYGEQLLAGPK